jgi:alpha-tubulin suppressor-like RCC1 family protein
LVSEIPLRVAGVTDAVAVATTYGVTCALTSGGTVQCLGSAPVGDGTTNDAMTPVAISGLSGATAIANGAASFALMPQGTVEAWGTNYNGQLGNGTRTPALSPVPVTGMVGAIAIAAGEAHACAAFPDGTVKCWGSNFGGQLGDGTTTDSATPVIVQW